jgi:hypothetical protein|tara:strand:+ start:18545 stop:19123 length:579 start_codon:yes stop_codon:yes gene_type:complete
MKIENSPSRFNFDGLSAADLVLMLDEVTNIEEEYLDEEEFEALKEGVEALEDAIIIKEEEEKIEKEEEEKKKADSEDKSDSKSKKRRALSKAKREAWWGRQIKEAIVRIESKTNGVEWSNTDQRGEIINGYLEKKHLFEIKRGFSIYTLRIIDPNLKERYHKETKFLTHNSPHYGKLKEKAAKIVEKFVKDE